MSIGKNILRIVILFNFLDILSSLVDPAPIVPLEVRFKELTKNSTSCEELLLNVKFNATPLLEEDWRIFYYWNVEREPLLSITKFSWPHQVLIDRFRSELHLKPPVNWNSTTLFIETSFDYSALLVQIDESGIFRIIPSTWFSNDIPYGEMALKFVSPSYLLMMNCEYRYGYAMAPFDSMPDEKHIDEAISTLNITSAFNETYLVQQERMFQSVDDDELQEDTHTNLDDDFKDDDDDDD